MPIVDAMLGLPAQPLHRLHQGARVPHLEHLGTEPHFQPLPAQPGRHRVNVLLDLDGTPLAHLHPLPLQRLQPPPRQRTQPGRLLLELGPSSRIPPGHQDPHELQVLLPAGEVAAAAQQQFLRQRLLEAPMALLAVAVLVPAVRVRGLGRHTVVTQEGLIAGRVLLGVAVVVNGQGHAVGAMTLGTAADLPQGVLQSFAQAGEALREAQRHVLPVRVGEHEVIEQVRQPLALDSHTQAVHVGEVRRTQSARLMHLAEEDFLGRPVPRLPLAHAPLQRASLTVPILGGVFALQPAQERSGLQGRLALQQLLQTRPDASQRIGPGAPGVRRARFARQSAQLAILPCGLAIHVCLHRRSLERCSLVKVPPDFLDLRITDPASCSHRQLLLQVKLPE
jgi:hypothetical protein